MAYNALQLITRSFYLSQIVSRDLQTPNASQITDGLYLLNAILDYKSTDLRLIPYFKRYDFLTVPNQEEYFIPELLYVDSLTFNLGVVRYSMTQMSRYDYFATPRVDNIANLPFSYRVERELGGARIYLYFLPGQVFNMKLSGKFGLTDVNLNTDLQQIYDLYYIEYLRYELANYICSEWGATFPDQAMKKYEEIRKKLMDVSPADLSIRKITYFSGTPPLDWQTVNLSNGWFPF
jgi:hypothetical protein